MTTVEPVKDEHALVDVIDVLLRDGAVVRADVVISVAEVPLVGLKLTAAIAGMETMVEYGMFQQWDVRQSSDVIARRRYTEEGGSRRLKSSRVAIEKSQYPDRTE